MFRITRTEKMGARTFRLEGSLTAEQLPLLDTSIRGLCTAEVVLDLSGLSWIDGAAAARLHALRSAGAWLAAGSPFVERLLASEER